MRDSHAQCVKFLTHSMPVTRHNFDLQVFFNKTSLALSLLTVAGSNMGASTMKKRFLDVILATTLLAMVVSSFAFSWQSTSPFSYGFGMSMSADGRILCALGSATRPTISTNSGQTWAAITNTSLFSPFYLDGVAVSADGTKIFIAMASNSVPKASIFVSSDWGATWTLTGFPSVDVSANYAVACSADGTKIIAASANQPIFYSTNGGVNCFTSSAPNLQWKSVASSSDGRRIVAAETSSVYSSDDFGATWIAQTNLPSQQSWNSVCISSDGNWVGATTPVHSYISGDSGVSWRTISLSGNSIACSANGTNWLIARAEIDTSTNSGITWQTFASGQCNAGAMYADGDEIAVTSTFKGIWLGRETPSPELKIQTQPSGFALSWIIPSTNFVLQQNGDLATMNWTTVSNRPTLNFSNLQEEASVPASGSNTFYRLMAQ
jgi:photosystem II stability/assembly factor-like uncharacterized protein